MDFLLAKNEEVLKEYDYSVTKKNRKKIQNTLYVTNKRIINESSGVQGFSREEIPVEAVDYIDVNYTTIQKSIIGIIICILLAIGCVVGAIMSKINYIYIGTGVFALLAIILLILFLLSRTARFTLVLSGKMYQSSLLSVTASIGKPKIKSLKIKVDKDTSKKMLEEIGAMILDVKNNKCDVVKKEEPVEVKPTYVEPLVDESEVQEETVEEQKFEDSSIE